MILGFTGTERGMTRQQRATYRYLIRELDLKVLHHGDCVGADVEADMDARVIGVKIIIHPPLDPHKRAFCVALPPHETRSVKPYLKRNRDIITGGIDGLIACPRQPVEPNNKRGDGTWTTVGYARQAGRRIWIILPDGTFREEQPRALTV